MEFQRHSFGSDFYGCTLSHHFSLSIPLFWRKLFYTYLFFNFYLFFFLDEKAQRRLRRLFISVCDGCLLHFGFYVLFFEKKKSCLVAQRRTPAHDLSVLLWDLGFLSLHRNVSPVVFGPLSLIVIGSVTTGDLSSQRFFETAFVLSHNTKETESLRVERLTKLKALHRLVCVHVCGSNISEVWT